VGPFLKKASQTNERSKNLAWKKEIPRTLMDKIPSMEIKISNLYGGIYTNEAIEEARLWYLIILGVHLNQKTWKMHVNEGL